MIHPGALPSELPIRVSVHEYGSRSHARGFGGNGDEVHGALRGAMTSIELENEQKRSEFVDKVIARIRARKMQ